MEGKLTLSEVVNSFLIEQGEDSEHKFAQYLTFGLRILKELNMDVKGGLRSRILTPDPNNKNRYNLPPDCVKLSRIGICDNGMLVGMAVEPNLCLVEKLDDCGNVVIQPIASDSQTLTNAYELSIYWTDEFAYGEYIGGRYGQRGGQSRAGVYRVDEEQRQIIAGSLISGTELIIEYVSDGVSDPESIYVHPLLEEALIAGIRWIAIRSKKRIPMNAILEARKEYYNQKRLARARNFPSKDELIQYARRGYQSAPKL
jgi:hypothetical protein